MRQRTRSNGLTRHFEPLQDQNESASDRLVQDFLCTHGVQFLVGRHSIAVAIDTIHVWSSGCSAILVILKLEAALQTVGATGLSNECRHMRQNCFDQDDDQRLQVRQRRALHVISIALVGESIFTYVELLNKVHPFLDTTRRWRLLLFAFLWLEGELCDITVLI
jgi:hypothetical protein